MKRLFGPKSVLDDGTKAWIFDTFAWALTNLGTDLFHSHIQLVLPDEAFFPDKLNSSDDIANTVFERVRQHAGMSDRPCVLVAQEEDANPIVGPALMIEDVPSGPAGSFSVYGRKDPSIEISYNRNQIDQPEALVATFAHELAHYLIYDVSVPTPGGEDVEEQATDLVAVFLGFGVFLANSAFTFSQYTDVDSQGWASSTQGYLSEDELIYCLAVFLDLKGIEQDAVKPFLDRHLIGQLKRSVKSLIQEQDSMQELHNIISHRRSTPGM